MKTYIPDDFVIQYPGVYEGKQKAAMAEYLEKCRQINERDYLDIKALVNGTLPEDTPGIGPVLKVTEAMVRYNADKYDPDNRLLHDAEYARSLGYKDIPAFATYVSNDDIYTAPFPPQARDTLLVSQLCHESVIYKPIYPGDTLYFVHTKQNIIDITPQEGSVYRTVVLNHSGAVYNQHGEKVNDLEFNIVESVRLFKDGILPTDGSFTDTWESPEWTRRPAHYYTDADWERIREIWRGEKRRGKEPLYWEDVRIGDEGAVTADGPIIDPLCPLEPYGMGVGGSRTLRHEILDDEVLKTLIREEKTGIYISSDPKKNVPETPDGIVPFFPSAKEEDEGGFGVVNSADIHKSGNDRAALLNLFGRDLAIRHINNWMGDHGRLYSVRWGMMPPEGHAEMDKPVPKSPNYKYFVKQVPYMRYRQVEVHGLTTDLAIVHSHVIEKFCRNGEFFVKLVWWIEEIEGKIWLDGEAVVQLPSKK